MKVHAVPAFNDNYIWLIESDHSRQAMIVDPGDAAPVIAALQQYQLEPVAILITHHHYDHVGGIEQLTQHYSIPVYGPVGETIPSITCKLSACERLVIHENFHPVTILDTPGHTNGHISYLIEDGLFCGDTLFAGGCGRLLGGTTEQLFASLTFIATLPADTRIFCAHEYTQANLRFAMAADPNNMELQNRSRLVAKQREQEQATVPSLLEEELATNPFLRCDQVAIRHRVEQHCGHSLSDAQSVFTELRRWKDQF